LLQPALDLGGVGGGMLASDPHPRHLAGHLVQTESDEHALLAGHLTVAGDLGFQSGLWFHGANLPPSELARQVAWLTGPFLQPAGFTARGTPVDP
jgi:hypothetical protein